MKLITDTDLEQVFLHKEECYLVAELPGVPVHTGCETGEDWVKVKRRLSKGDNDKLSSAAASFRMSVSASGRMSEGQVQLGAAEFENMAISALVVGVKDWSFPVPVTVENIRRLDNADAEMIVERCNRMWHPPRTDDETKNSSTPSAPLFETNNDHQPNSGG